MPAERREAPITLQQSSNSPMATGVPASWKMIVGAGVIWLEVVATARLRLAFSTTETLPALLGFLCCLGGCLRLCAVDERPHLTGNFFFGLPVLGVY